VGTAYIWSSEHALSLAAGHRGATFADVSAKDTQVFLPRPRPAWLQFQAAFLSGTTMLRARSCRSLASQHRSVAQFSTDGAASASGSPQDAPHTREGGGSSSPSEQAVGAAYVRPAKCTFHTETPLGHNLFLVRARQLRTATRRELTRRLFTLCFGPQSSTSCPPCPASASAPPSSVSLGGETTASGQCSESNPAWYATQRQRNAL